MKVFTDEPCTLYACPPSIDGVPIPDVTFTPAPLPAQVAELATTGGDGGLLAVVIVGAVVVIVAGLWLLRGNLPKPFRQGGEHGGN